MRFSQRIGKRPIKTVLQVDSMDTDLRNRLWNTVLESFLNRLFNYVSQQKSQTSTTIWKEFYKLPIDEIPTCKVGDRNEIDISKFVKEWFFKAEWDEVYDFIQFIVELDTGKIKVELIEACNQALEKEVSGYRIINEKVVQITSEEEIQAIEEAALNTDQWKSVSIHLKAALDNLADRKNPNYRNSIKESISAVESFCKIITNDDKATLAKALAEIEKSHKLHKGLKNGLSAIYGYTSDSGGSDTHCLNLM